MLSTVVKIMNDFLDKKIKRSIDLGYIFSKIEVVTPYGKEHKEKLIPFLPGEEELLQEEFNKVNNFISLIKEDRIFFTNLKNLFAHVKDLRQSVSTCAEGYVMTEVELFEIKNFSILIKEIKKELEKITFNPTKDMEVQPMDELERLFDPRGEGLKTFYIYDDYSQELMDIRKEKKAVEERIVSEKKELNKGIQQELGVRVNHKGIVTVSKADLDLIGKIEGHPGLTYNSETYMDIKYSLKSTEIIDSLERELDNLKKREENEEFKIRNQLSKEIANYSRELFSNMDAIGKLDLIISKAYFAIDIKGVMPEIKKDHIVHIDQGRHLKVQEALMRNNQEFTPISVNIKDGVTCITGANMGGKTVTLKLIGMLCAMVQYGLHVPCNRMEMGLHDFVYLSIGDWQSVDQGLSTFGAEIKGIQRALVRTEERGLILIDELARGTNPEEGHAISKAIVYYLKDKECISVITTHYDNVANSNDVVHLQVIGLANVDYEMLKEKLELNKNHGIDLVVQYMDYRLKEVYHSSEVPRDAINVARLMGLDNDIIAFAERELYRKQ